LEKIQKPCLVILFQKADWIQVVSASSSQWQSYPQPYPPIKKEKPQTFSGSGSSN
jgi:hypothetical protein